MNAHARRPSLKAPHRRRLLPFPAVRRAALPFPPAALLAIVPLRVVLLRVVPLRVVLLPIVPFSLLSLSYALAPHLPAQGASGTQHFIVSTEPSSSQTSGSFVFRLAGGFGDGIVPERSTSTNWILLGGFPAQIDQPLPPRPWLAGVQPLFVTANSAAPLTVWGTQMDQGAAPALTIGGVSATIGTRQRASSSTTLPNGVEPGWQPVALSTHLGTSGITRGVGVLPMLEVVSPVRSLEPVHYLLRGTPGDQFVLAIAFGRSPVGFVLPGYGYSLQLELATLVVLPPFAITRPDGQWLLIAPPTYFATPLWMQSFILSTATSYAPGSFTNVVRIF